MAFVQRMLLIAGVAAIGAMAAPQRGNNEYLPPNKGYDYPKPDVPFTSAPPVYRPPVQNNPQPTYRPPVQNNPQPTYGPPPVQQPTYRPPVQNNPQPTYGPPPVQQPTYRPPVQNIPVQQPVYRPPNPPPTYGPPQQDIGTGGSGNHNQVHDHGHGHDHVHEAGMPYDFNYAVKDDYYGTDFSQNEASDGDNVKGEYRVQLPDGRLQIVTYTADWKTGFHAVVTYQGEAKYPEQAPYVPQPSNNNQNRVQGDKGYNYQPPQTPVKPANSYGAPNY